MFSGDAPPAFVVDEPLAHQGDAAAGLGPGPAYVRFFASPFVLARAREPLSVGEMVKELYQAGASGSATCSRASRRGGWYVVLRGITNVLLRDLNISLVAEPLLRGAPDDLRRPRRLRRDRAPRRPDAAPSRCGRWRGSTACWHARARGRRGAARLPRSSSCPTTGRRSARPTSSWGRDAARLGARAHGRAGRRRASRAAPGEDWGPLNALVNSALNLSRGSDRPRPRPGTPEQPAAAGDLPDVVTVGSGNLGLVWFPQVPHRLTLEDFQERWPGLVDGLAARPGVGVVVVDTAEQGLVAIGPRGLRPAGAGRRGARGEDPLAAVRPARARRTSLRAARLPHTGDLLLISTVTRPGHVHAFEGQVGSHGGIGGGAEPRASCCTRRGWAMADELREPVGDDEILRGRRVGARAADPLGGRGRPAPDDPAAALARAREHRARRRRRPPAHRPAAAAARRPAAPPRRRPSSRGLAGRRRRSCCPTCTTTTPSSARCALLDGVPVLTAPGERPLAARPRHRGGRRAHRTRTGGRSRAPTSGSGWSRPCTSTGRCRTGRTRRTGSWSRPESFRIWFAGDTAPFAAMADIPALAGGPIDLALVPVGGWGPRLSGGHMDPVQAARACAIVGRADRGAGALGDAARPGVATAAAGLDGPRGTRVRARRRAGRAVRAGARGGAGGADRAGCRTRLTRRVAYIEHLFVEGGGCGCTTDPPTAPPAAAGSRGRGRCGRDVGGRT